MRIYLITFFILSFSVHASDKLHLELISGNWVCSNSYQEEEVTIKETTKYSYDINNFTYSYRSNAEMLYQNKIPVGTVQVIEEGSFTYESAKIIYDLKSVKTDVLDDPLEAISGKVIKEMEEELRNDKTPYQTTFINEKEWETKDPNDNSKILCKRDITN
ncbi:hypothetical protein CWB89_08640 [Pseudoalteromonas piscicida]|uniref:Lipocalin-like domain-containing protein n=2 Tax=Pseudoalteromonas piscicida TaxID=43662 RepID=A0AAQ2EW92_PSEO7|nr:MULTISPECIES: hypothetical protein [Pseudoalteromonas]KJY87005.1 hypothetical protein TW75_15740 [Pseudoalteromonas piscicida]TMN38581.1 hypothetical protein CWB94_13670 [Pseudoalteromonas piscicida]TMN45087.1 hypothetical protein CWB95_02550 [Pseudoalteromonas piscicida]TMN50066.1 hypothetical protein CWB92_14225 [Pseudoalteromonas piscicida]TMN51924.1 hypothetical protein CWB91_12140 [Pseudoalteromonas piscicida]